MKRLAAVFVLLLAGVALAQKTVPDQIWGTIYNAVLPNFTTSPQTTVWQGFSTGQLRVTGLVTSPQFLLLAPGTGFILQTNAVAKICLAGTC